MLTKQLPNLKHCNRCKTTEGDLYISGHAVICRACNTLKQREKYARNKACIVRAIKKYELKNPERRVAWTKASKLPLKPCEVCGDAKTHRHHPDIDKPLEVVYLCPLHHAKADQIKIKEVL